MTDNRVQLSEHLAFGVDENSGGQILLWRVEKNPQVHLLSPQEATTLAQALLRRARVHAMSHG